MLGALAFVLPLMMGNRTPATLTASMLALVAGALAAAMPALWRQGEGALRPPPRGWLVFAAVMTAVVAVQVWPSETLADWLGPYPAALWDHPGFTPATWSPNPSATLLAWAVFVVLFLVAWLAMRLGRRERNWLWLAVAGTALFQALYGLIAHAGGAETIFGVWERNTPDYVHGSFSNRNLFGAYLALTWPMTLAVWWIRDMPGLDRLPRELRFTGTVICGAIIGAAMLGSASRLGSAAGLFGMLLMLVLWNRHRGYLGGGSVWPAWTAAIAGLIAATWYGLVPLTERLLSLSLEEHRLELFRRMLTDFPLQWWLTGVGLGGFEAVFKQIQPGEADKWFDYAHNDLLQWLIEMGVAGALLLAAVVRAVWRRARLSTERIPLYAGMGALCLVALGDFSWHMPATQVVLAMYLGVLLAPGRRSMSVQGDPG